MLREGAAFLRGDGALPHVAFGRVHPARSVAARESAHAPLGADLAACRWYTVDVPVGHGHQPTTRTFAIEGVAQTQRDPPRTARAPFVARPERPALRRSTGLSKQSVAQLRGVYQILSDFVPAPAEGIKMMRAARAVPDVFLEASAVAAENDASMQATTGLDPVKTRLVITRNLRLEPLAAAAEALARDLRYNMFRERWDVVQQALQVYNLARGYTRNARAPSLVAPRKDDPVRPRALRSSAQDETSTTAIPKQK